MGILEALVTLATIAASVAVPLTTFLLGRSKHKLTRLQQRHDREVAKRELEHGITKEYLDRVLKPETPFAIKYATLRFLSFPDDKERLQAWAKSELQGMDTRKLEVDQGVHDAAKAVDEAKDVREHAVAVAKLRIAVQQQQVIAGSADELTPEAIRAGFYRGKDLDGVILTGADLRRADFGNTSLVGADLTGADLTFASLRDADLQGAKLVEANLEGAFFQNADLTGADFSGANIGAIHGLRFGRPFLHGATFTGVRWSNTSSLTGFYDDSTQWPDGFDPGKTECVKMTRAEIDARRERERKSKREARVRELESLGLYSSEPDAEDEEPTPAEEAAKPADPEEPEAEAEAELAAEEPEAAATAESQRRSRSSTKR